MTCVFLVEVFQLLGESLPRCPFHDGGTRLSNSSLEIEATVAFRLKGRHRPVRLGKASKVPKILGDATNDNTRQVPILYNFGG